MGWALVLSNWKQSEEIFENPTLWLRNSFLQLTSRLRTPTNFAEKDLGFFDLFYRFGVGYRRKFRRHFLLDQPLQTKRPYLGTDTTNREPHPGFHFQCSSIEEEVQHRLPPFTHTNMCFPICNKFQLLLGKTMLSCMRSHRNTFDWLLRHVASVLSTWNLPSGCRMLKFN